MNDYFDSLETRDAEARERAVLAQLPRQLAHAKAAAPAYAALFAGIDPAAIDSGDAWAKLPVTRKSALLESQRSARPFGGFAAARWGEARLREEPGFFRLLAEPEGPQ